MGSWKLIAHKNYKKDGGIARDCVSDLSESDLEHIASLIKQGFTSGELNDEE